MSLQTIEQLKAEQDKAIAMLEAKHTLLRAQPESVRDQVRHVFPHDGYSFQCPWVTFEVKTAAEAVAILRAYGTPLAIDCRKRGCTSIAPAEHQGKNYRDTVPEWTVPNGVQVTQNGGKGFYTCSLSAWVDGQKVIVEFDPEWRLRDSVSAHYDRHGEVISVNFRRGALAGYERFTKFGGGSLDSFNTVYTFAGLDSAEKALQPQQVAA